MRLSELNPESVAEDAVRAVQDFVASLHMRTSMGGPIDLETQWPCSTLRSSARALSSYAISGQRLDAPAIEYVQTLAEALYIRPADGASYETGDLLDEAEPSTSWGLVIRAALAREAIAAGEDLRGPELAILASLTPVAVRKLIQAGEIRTRKRRDDDGPGSPASLVTATEARRWLSGRGVPGF